MIRAIKDFSICLFLLFMMFPLLANTNIESIKEEPVFKEPEACNCSKIASEQSQEKCDCSKIVSQQAVKEDSIKTYQEILEKTNSQLSMWTNPYGIFVAVLGALIACLGVLFTICSIIFGYILYKQSKESQERIENVIKDSQGKIDKSLDDHKKKLKGIEKENKEYLSNLVNGFDGLILEYKDKLKNIEDKSFINKMESFKDFFETKKNTYRHSGRDPVDISDDNTISKNTAFSSKILLDAPDQRFTIFMKILGSDNKKYWLGFGGRVINENEKTWLSPSGLEFDILRNYNSEIVDINENIFDQFKRGFPQIEPVKIIGIRFRGSDENKNEITFSYKISQS